MRAARSSLVGMIAWGVLMGAAAMAEDRFKGDGTAGGLMPDFSQRQGQEIKGICAAAAFADALWYLDQHGFSGLVAHTKPKKPNAPWKDDAKTLVLELADLIFGKDYMAGKATNGISNGGQKGISSYLKNKGFDKPGKNDRPALAYKRREGMDAIYGWWRYYVESDAFYPAVGDFSWRDDKGKIKTTKDSKDRDIQIRHAMTAGGRDTDNGKTHVTMGWEDHPAEKPPYGKPPYAKDETPYFDTYDIELTGVGAADAKRMRLPNQKANLFDKYPADYISLDAIESIENPKIDVKRRTPLPPTLAAAPAGLGDSLTRYEYEIANSSANDFAAKQFFIEIKTPFDPFTVTAPLGWAFELWDPKLTPEITPSPPALTDEGLVDPEAGAWNPDFSGLLFYTNNDSFAVLPGSTLPGFSYAFDSSYTLSANVQFAGVSSSPVALFNPSYVGSTTEYSFIGGPVPVPEPATCLLCLTLLSLAAAKRRSAG